MKTKQLNRLANGVAALITCVGIALIAMSLCYGVSTALVTGVALMAIGIIVMKTANRP